MSPQATKNTKFSFRRRLSRTIRVALGLDEELNLNTMVLELHELIIQELLKDVQELKRDNTFRQILEVAKPHVPIYPPIVTCCTPGTKPIDTAKFLKKHDI